MTTILTVNAVLALSALLSILGLLVRGISPSRVAAIGRGWAAPAAPERLLDRLAPKHA